MMSATSIRNAPNIVRRAVLGGAFAGLLVCTLAACASGPVGPGTGGNGSGNDNGNGGTGDEPTTSEQTVSEACMLGKSHVDAALAEAQSEFEKAQESVLSGEFPDLQSFADVVSRNIETATSDVSNSEVLALLDEARTALTGLGEIQTPDSLLGAPSYAGKVATQLEKLQAAGAELQTLCNAG